MPRIIRARSEWNARRGVLSRADLGVEFVPGSGEAMQAAVDVTSVFEAYFARNRGPVPGDPEARQPPNYGVSASIDGSVINLTLTFRAGSAYCCYERGCHLSLYEGRRWEGLRRDLSTCGIAVPPRLELRSTTIVEAGALFFDFSRPDRSRRGWYAFNPARAHRFQHVVNEGGDSDALNPSGDVKPED